MVRGGRKARDEPGNTIALDHRPALGKTPARVAQKTKNTSGKSICLRPPWAATRLALRRDGSENQFAGHPAFIRRMATRKTDPR